MIRKAKQAKITYAKRGKVNSPVDASTRAVQDAAVTSAALRRQKQANVSDASPVSAGLKTALSAEIVACSADKPELRKVNCKTAQKDITIKTLFSNKE